MFELTVRQRIAALVLLIFLGLGGFLLFLNKNGHYGESYSEQVPVNKVYVHVCGAVSKPGVICLKPATRKFEVLQLAGGALPEADLSRVNLSEFALDGEQIYVPRQGEVSKSRKVAPKPGTGKLHSTVGNFSKPKIIWPLDVNKATIAEIESVPGIGPSLASKIIEYRTRYGFFQKYEDLLKVNGIGNAKLEKFRSFLDIK